MNEQDDTPDFEAALSELEQLVMQMEEGSLSLEESLQAFEKGIRLTRLCQNALRTAEQRVRILQEENGELQESAFYPEAFDDDENERE